MISKNSPLKELFLYSIFLFISILVHGAIGLSQFFNPIIEKKPLKIRLAGLPQSPYKRGDLSQIKSPQKIHKSHLFKKQLQTSQKTQFKTSFVRNIKQPRPQNSPRQPIQKPLKKVSKTLPPRLDLKSLGYRPMPNLPSFKMQHHNVLKFIEQHKIFEQLTGQLASLDLKKLSSSVQIEIPNGTKLDQLNSTEKKFYSFQLRAYKAYVYSLLNQAYRQQTDHYRFPFVKTQELLQAKVTFDRNGDITRVQTIKTSQNSALQNVFLVGIQDIGSLPNPPKEILNKQGEFTLNFILQIYR